jgi:hypothetical protein
MNNTLTYCLNVLKIKEDTEVYRKAVELAERAPIESNEWISAIKNIANASRTYIYSQSQLSDFLTLAAKGIEENKTSSEIIIFNMYRDIIENYDKFSNRLKSNYPAIIVDVISVLNQGTDTKGTKVNIIGLERYYQSRKQQAAKGKEKTLITTTTAAAIHKEKILLSKDELVERLAQITNRERKQLQKSIEKLPYSDLKKLSELSHNYSKLQRYSKLLTTKGQLKNEIQREIGRELRSHELTRAANSIRRAKIYIENILDNKFTLDTSHGINHIKHNLEYGYSLLNLIELPRRRPRTGIGNRCY